MLDKEDLFNETFSFPVSLNCTRFLIIEIPLLSNLLLRCTSRIKFVYLKLGYFDSGIGCADFFCTLFIIIF